MEQAKFNHLLNEYLAGHLNAAGAGELLAMINDPVLGKQLEEIVERQLNAGTYDQELLLPQTHQRLKAGLQKAIAAPAPPISLWQKFAVAAAAIVLIVGGVLWFSRGNPAKELAGQQLPKHIVPGQDGAVLTLANGEQMLMDTMVNGLVAVQNGTQVRLNKGVLSYYAGNANAGTIAYNTVSTPKGRQFHLMLPDGSQAWLNAASSLKFPAAFSGNSRQVEITGEVCLDIVPDPAKPFSVKTGKGAFTDVLGTTININAYPEENSIKTTLIEGSVRTGMNKLFVILKPGEQAAVTEVMNTPIAVQQVNLAKVMAWKNGLFDFEDMPLEQVMRQLARWYNLDIVYEKGIPDIQFGGKLSRNVSFDGLMKGLEKAGLRFRISGERTLVILP